MSEFRMVDVGAVIVADRGREGIGDAKKFDELVQSIRNHKGIWHPIVIHSNMTLVAGFRRLSAYKHLEWSEIPAHIYEELSPLRQKEIELEENIIRHDLTWDERVKLWNQIHKVKQEIHGEVVTGRPRSESDAGTTTEEPQAVGEASATQSSNGGSSAPSNPTGWGIQDTANLVGKHQAEVSRALKLARIMEVFPGLSKLAKNEAEAHKIIDKLIEELERELSVRSIKKLDQNVFHGDCRDVLRTLATASVDCIIMDPPYGVNLQAIGGAIKGHRGGAHFDDSMVNTIDLLKEVLPELRRILKPQGHLYSFFAITSLGDVQKLYVDAGFDTDDMPLIWVKDATRWGTGDWRFHFPKEYEPIVFASGHVDGGERRSLNYTHGNTFHYPKLEEPKWPAQKPFELLEELIKLSTREGEVVLDCFAGSGSTPVACFRTGRRYIAIEKDERMYKVMIERLHNLGEAQAALERAAITAKSQEEIAQYLEEHDEILEGDDETPSDDNNV